MTTHIAIVGSGPTGCYLTEALAKSIPDAQIDVIDKLPTPFGLVRAGVAPDHQGTKNIVRQYERTFSKSNVRFLGNVEIGRDLTYAELKAAYHIVVIAIGALQDRSLNITGENLDGVYGSGAFVGWYNGHPDYQALKPNLNCQKMAVIGNGNVSLDIVRLLCKTQEELNQSDICAHAARAITESPLEEIYLIGRRGPIEASFTSAELEELGHLARAVPNIEATVLPDVINPQTIAEKDLKIKQKNLDILKSFVSLSPEGKAIKIHLLFYMNPVAIVGTTHVTGLTLQKNHVENGAIVPTSEQITLPVETIISAIGYRATPFADLPFDLQKGIVLHTEGRVHQQNGTPEPFVYTAGWCKRGPNGVIPANRADALNVAKIIAADWQSHTQIDEKIGGAQVDNWLATRQVRVVHFSEWQKINQNEIERAEHGKPREKFTSIAEMLAVL